MSSIHIACYLLYGVSAVIILIIFISLSRHLFCSGSTSSSSSKSTSHRNRSSHGHNNRDHNGRRRSFSGPSAISSHNRADSISSVGGHLPPHMENIDSIIMASAQQNHISPSINIPNPIDTTSAVTKGYSSTPSTLTTNTFSSSVSTSSKKKKQNNNLNVMNSNIINSDNNNNNIDNSLEKSRSNHSHTRSLSFTMQSQLPHAVLNVVNNIKGMLNQMEYRGYELNEIHLIVRLSSIISCFGFLICVTMICIYFCFESFLDGHEPNHGTDNSINPQQQENTNSNSNSLNQRALYSMAAVSLIFYGFGKFALYICTVSRLYYSLEGGIFQYGINIYAMIVLYLIVDFVIVLASVSSLYVAAYNSFIICMLIFYFMDIFYLLGLYILFTKQIMKLIKDTVAYTSPSLNTLNNNNSNKNTNNKSNANSSGSSGSSSSSASSSSNNNNNKHRNNKNKMDIELQISSNVASPTSSPTSDDKKNDDDDDIIIDNELGGTKSRASLDRSKISQDVVIPTIANKKHTAYIGKHKASGMEYVTKYTVLITWSVLSSLSMIILISSLGNDFVTKFNDTIIIHIIWSVDCSINAFNIYLYFIFGVAIYKFMCGICHNVTSKICDKFINNMFQ